MPTLQSMNFPTPKNWDDFESICLNSFKIRWNNPNLSKNGRQGQAQHGVDIFGLDNTGNQIGIQCKKYEGALTLKTVEEEIENAMQFQPSIISFYIATTAPTDAKLQRDIRILSERRRSEHKFSVDIFFWDDIVQVLAIDEAIFKSHFPQFEIKAVNSQLRTLALFDIAYRGLSFKINLDLILDEMSEDIGQILILCTMIESAARRLICENDLKNLVDDLNMLKEHFNAWFRGNEMTQENVTLVQNLAQQIVHKINAIQYDLKQDDLAVFTLGSRIVNWDYLQTTGQTFEEKSILDMLKVIFNEVPTDLQHMITSCKNDDSVIKVNYPHRFFILCRRHFIGMQILE